MMDVLYAFCIALAFGAAFGYAANLAYRKFNTLTQPKQRPKIEFTEATLGHSVFIDPIIVSFVVQNEAGVLIGTMQGQAFIVHGTSVSVAKALGIAVQQEKAGAVQ